MFTSNSAFVLRGVALLGTSGVLLKHILASPPPDPRHEYSLYIFGGVLLATVFTLLIALPKATLRIIRHPDLLVPLGCYFLAQEALSWWLLRKGFSVNLAATHNQPLLLLAKQVTWLLPYLALSVIFSGWLTRLAWQAIERDEVDLLSGLRSISQWLPRALGVILLGNGIVFLLTIAFIALDLKSTTLFLALLLLATILWNIATIALLPVVLNSPASLARALALGFKVSNLNIKRLLLPVFLKLLLVGCVVYAAVGYTKTNYEFGESSSNYSFNNKVSYQVNALWVGDFNSQNKWHDFYMETLEIAGAPAISFRLNFLMLLLSLAVMLKICSTILGPESSQSQATTHYLPDFASSNTSALSLKSSAITLCLIAALFLTPFEMSKFTASLVRDKTTASSQKLGEPRVIKAWEGFSSREFYQEAREMRGINDIAAGELDGKPGLDVVIAGGEMAITLDRQGQLKRKTPYQFAPSDDGDTKNVYFYKVNIIDLEKDGKCEYWANGHSQPLSLLNNEGRWLAKYPQPESGFSADSLAAGDIDGDGVTELLASHNGKLALYDQKGRIIWRKTVPDSYTSNVDIFDIDGDSTAEILVGTFRNSLVLGKGGETLKTINKPSSSLGWLLEPGQRPLNIFMGDNQVGLFTLDGALTAKYPAPLSEIPNPSLLNSDDLMKSLEEVKPFSVQAVRVRLIAGQPKQLAVLAFISVTSGSQMLYIYNNQGELMYQELFATTNPMLRVLPAESPEAADSLLLHIDGTVRQLSRT